MLKGQIVSHVVKIILQVKNKTGIELSGADIFGSDFGYCSARLESELGFIALRRFKSCLLRNVREKGSCIMLRANYVLSRLVIHTFRGFPFFF